MANGVPLTIGNQPSLLGAFASGQQFRQQGQDREAALAKAARLQELQAQLGQAQAAPQPAPQLGAVPQQQLGAAPQQLPGEQPALGPAAPTIAPLGVTAAPSGPTRAQLQRQLETEFPEVAAQQVKDQKAKFDSQTEREKQRFTSVAKSAARIQGLPADQQIRILEQDRTRMQSQGITDLSDTDEQIGLLREGRIDEANALTDQAVQFGQSVGILEDVSRGGARGLASAKTEILPGGTVIQALPSGDVQVRDPAGNLVTGEAREAAIDASKEFQLELAERKAAISVDTETKKAAAKAGVELETEPEIKAAVAQAVDEVKTATKISGEERSNAIASNTYNAAMKGLVDSLAKTDTGPFVGLLPVLTSDQQIAEGAIAAMGPVLKALFRQSGEGTFTDKDQEILTAMLPTRKDTPKARVAKLQNIDAIIRAKLTQPDIGAPPATIQAGIQQVGRFTVEAE